MSALSNYSVNTNLNGVNGYGTQFSNTVYNTRVAATTNTQLTVPSTVGIGQALNQNPKLLAVFGYQSGATVFVASSATGATTAAPDTSGAFAASSGLINPSAMLVTGGDVLNFYAVAQDYVSVAFYSVT